MKRQMTDTEKTFFNTIQFEELNGTKYTSNLEVEAKTILFTKQAMRFNNEQLVFESLPRIAKSLLMAMIVNDVSDELSTTFFECYTTLNRMAINRVVGYNIMEEGHYLTASEVENLAKVHKGVCLSTIKLLDGELKEFAKQLKKHPKDFGIKLTNAGYKETLKVINELMNDLRKEANDSYQRAINLIKD